MYCFAGDLAGETIGFIRVGYTMVRDYRDLDRYFSLLRLSRISLNFISRRWLFFFFSKSLINCLVSPS